MSEEVVIKFAQKLASNESKIRSKTVKKIRKWLAQKSESSPGFTEADLLKLWKGLHYCMWMSDKPLVQEELAENLAVLTHVFKDFEVSLQFVSAYFKTQIKEWNNIDRLRLDKFMMLMRKYLHQSFVLVRQRNWKKDHIRAVVTTLTEAGVIGSQVDNVPTGLRFHIADIYLDELAKVGAEQLDKKKTLLFLETFCTMLTVEKNKLMVKYIMKHVFDVIIKQAVDELTQQSDDSDTEEQPPRLKFDYSSIADKLFQLASSSDCLGRNRKLIYNLVKKFKSLAEGIIPVDPSNMDNDSELSDDNVNAAVNRLVVMEDKIVLGERKRKLEMKKRKKNKNSETDPGEEPAAKKQRVEDNKKKTKNKFKEGEEQQKVKDKKKEQEKLNKEKKAAKKMKEALKKEDSDELSSDGENDDDLDDFSFDDDDDDDDDTVHIGAMMEDGDDSDDSMEFSDESDNESKTKGNSQTNDSESDESDEEINSKKSSPGVCVQNNVQLKDKSKKKGKSEEMIQIFKGGLMDSDEEMESETSGNFQQKPTEEITTPVSNKKRKKKNKLNMDEDIDCSTPSDKGSSKKNKPNYLKSSPDKGSNKKKKSKDTKSSSENSAIDKTLSPIKNIFSEISTESASKKNKKNKKSSVNDDLNSSQEEITLNISESKSKKSKKNSSKLSQSVRVVPEEVSVSSKKKKKKRRKSESDLAEVGSNENGEEVEIFVPNKKYKGKFSEWAEEQASKSISGKNKKTSDSGDMLVNVVNGSTKKGKENDGAQLGRKKAKKSGEQFMTFEKMSKTPPAFVKKSLMKVSPKTEPKKGNKKALRVSQLDLMEVGVDLPNSAGKRRVSFGLHKNMEQSTSENDSDSDSNSHQLNSLSDSCSSVTQLNNHNGNQDENCSSSGTSLQEDDLIHCYPKVQPFTDSEIEMNKSPYSSDDEHLKIEVEKMEIPKLSPKCSLSVKKLIASQNKDCINTPKDKSSSFDKGNNSSSDDNSIDIFSSPKTAKRYSVVKCAKAENQIKTKTFHSKNSNLQKNVGTHQSSDSESDSEFETIAQKNKIAVLDKAKVANTKNITKTIKKSDCKADSKKTPNESKDKITRGSSQAQTKPFDKEKSIMELERFLQGLKSKKDQKNSEEEKAKCKLKSGSGEPSEQLSNKDNKSKSSLKNDHKKILDKTGIKTDRLTKAMTKASDVLAEKTKSAAVKLKSTEEIDKSKMVSSALSRLDTSSPGESVANLLAKTESNLKRKLKSKAKTVTKASDVLTEKTKSAAVKLKSTEKIDKSKIVSSALSSPGESVESLLAKTETNLKRKLKSKSEPAPGLSTRRRKLIQELEDDSDCEIVEVTTGTGNQTKHVRTHDLSREQNNIITCGDWLNDIHINLAHALFKQQFPDCSGLENCCLGNQKQQAYSPLKKGDKFVQLFNYCANHWIAITNYSCGEKEVLIYDSFYRSFKRDLKKVLINLYGKNGSIKVMWPPFQRQSNTSECGLFAIAAACSVLHGDDPSGLAYKERGMRAHLVMCFKDKNMSPFPTVKSKSEKLPHKVVNFDLSKRC